MEGFVRTISLAEAKKGWHALYLKADDISAQLLAFSDRSQAEQRWRMQLRDADIATPIPGDPSHGEIPQIDETAHCFYVRETAAAKAGQWYFFSVADDNSKKQWMRLLVQIAKDGPRPPRFAQLSGATSPEKSSKATRKGEQQQQYEQQQAFAFHARVVQTRVHESGKHGVREYMVTCHCAIYSRVVGRRLTKEWSVWHRFSEFDELHDALVQALGAQMTKISFFKHKRDALRSMLGRSLDQDFLDARRIQLDTFISRVCELEKVVDFFKPHANDHLKAFFAFDKNCEDVDHSLCRFGQSRGRIKSPRKPKSANGQRASEDSDDRTSISSLRISDASVNSSNRYSDARGSLPSYSDGSLGPQDRSQADPNASRHQRDNDEVSSARTKKDRGSRKNRKEKHQRKTRPQAGSTHEEAVVAARQPSPTKTPHRLG